MDCVEIVHGAGKTGEILGPLRKSVKKWCERFSTAGIHLSLNGEAVESSVTGVEGWSKSSVAFRSAKERSFAE